MKARAIIISLAFMAVLPSAAAAGPEKESKVARLKALEALADLPRGVDEAVKAGATEDEIGKALGRMKKDKVGGEAAAEVAKHFRKQAEDDTDDHGLSDVVHKCLADGKRGTELVACVHEDWEKKPKKKKEHHGGPPGHGGPGGEVGPADAPGAEHHGQHGKPDDGVKSDDEKPGDANDGEHKGKPDKAEGHGDEGKPDKMDKHEDKGKPDKAGEHGDNDKKSDDKSKKKGKGGH